MQQLENGSSDDGTDDEGAGMTSDAFSSIEAGASCPIKHLPG